ncbi:MAG: hypothetical protein WBG46_05695 [Nonlabens sp.]
MKAAKYIFFLLCIAFVGGAIYFSLLSGEIKVQKELIINAPTPLVVEVLEDFGQWGSWNENVDIVPINDGLNGDSENTVALVNYQYENDESGTLTREDSDTDKNKRYSFKTEDNRELQMTIKLDSLDINSTKLLINIEGERDLKNKITSRLLGDDVTEEIIPSLTKPFDQLEKALKAKMQEFSITQPMKTATSGGYHLMMTQSTNLGFIHELKVKMETQILSYMSKNRIRPTGKTKLIFDKRDTDNNTAIITVAIPVQEKVITEMAGTIICAYKDPNSVVKSSLEGNLNNLVKVWKKMDDFISNNGLTQSNYAPWMVYEVDKSTVYNPADQITTLYIPVE